jgi:hypothetical protein
VSRVTSSVRDQPSIHAVRSSLRRNSKPNS